MKLKPPPMKLKPMKPPPMKPPPMKPPPMKPPRQPSLPGRDARIDRYNAIESGLLRWRCSQVFEGERALGVGEGGLGPRFSTESGFSGWRCSQSAAAVLVAVIVEYESNPRVIEATRADRMPNADTPIATFCWSYPSIGDPRPCLIWRKRHGECLMIIIACSLASRVECRQNICVMIV
jgi:hypothetical protein